MTVDILDGLDDAVRPLYVERDGKFHLDVSGLEDTSGLKSALDKERKAARDAGAQTAAWRALGKTPEEIKALLEASEKADEEKATKAGEWDKLKAQIVAKHEVDLQAERDKGGKMRTALDRYLIDAAAVTEIAKAKGVPELLLPHVQRQMKVVETDDGEFVARVVDAKGDPRVDGKGEFMAVGALIAEMRANAVFGRAFEADASGGGATGGGSGGAGGKKIMKTSDFMALDGKSQAARMAEGYTLAD
jgi:hypothetical protein